MANWNCYKFVYVFVNMMLFVSNIFPFLERVIRTQKQCWNFFVRRAVFFSSRSTVYVTFVRVLNTLVRCILTPTGRKVDMTENCLLTFQKCAPEKESTRERGWWEKRGGNDPFWNNGYTLRRLSSRTHKPFWLVESDSNGIRANGIKCSRDQNFLTPNLTEAFLYPPRPFLKFRQEVSRFVKKCQVSSRSVKKCQ